MTLGLDKSASPTATRRRAGRSQSGGGVTGRTGEVDAKEPTTAAGTPRPNSPGDGPGSVTPPGARATEADPPGYRADITAGGLRVPASRVVADLLLQGVDAEAFREAMVQRNLLQARNPVSGVRLGRLIRLRLQTMDAGLWRLVRDGSTPVATQATMAAAVKHSRLLRDFLDLVVQEQYLLFSIALSRSMFEHFLDACAARDPQMPVWQESTRTKLRRVVFQILAEAGYIENTRSLRLQPVHLAGPVVAYLQDRGETDVLRTLEVGP